MNRNPRDDRPTSWQGVSPWYDKTVGEGGHYYHQLVVLPGALRLLRLGDEPAPSLLDLACGQGVLARALPKETAYTGVDAAASLIHSARRLDPSQRHRYLVGDVTKPLPLEKTDFTHAAVILALQNVAAPQGLLANARRHLKVQGRLVIALNHPCFRIPRQTSWEIDARRQIQYRRVDRYMSPLDIPIKAHPSARECSPETTSFHRSLSDYSRWLSEAGFVIELLEEWISDKVSVGKAARMENRARAEFPMFLALLARLERKNPEA